MPISKQLQQQFQGVMALAGIHARYPRGQLNYLQTLGGDLEDRL